MRIGMSTYLLKLYSLTALDISRRKCDLSATWLVIIVIYERASYPAIGAIRLFARCCKNKNKCFLSCQSLALPAVCRKMIRDYGGKRIKAPSLDTNNTEQISLKVGALPHSTLPARNTSEGRSVPSLLQRQ